MKRRSMQRRLDLGILRLTINVLNINAIFRLLCDLGLHALLLHNLADFGNIHVNPLKWVVRAFKKREIN
jgi:hypothetical protein